jgi:uncharacterized protein (DUF488 family)
MEKAGNIMDQTRIDELRLKQYQAEQQQPEHETRFYTIGYAGLKTVSDLEEIMDKHGIGLLMDVRSKPNTRRFSKQELEQVFGDRYRSRTEMGGFDHEEDQFHEWCEVAAGGMGEIITAANAGNKVLVMCAEKSADKCHRKYFVARALEEGGHTVTHL